MMTKHIHSKDLSQRSKSTWRSYFGLALLTLVTALIQGSFLPVFLQEATPILIFTLPLALLALEKTNKACFSAFIGGLLFDLLTPGFWGVSSVIMLACLLVTYYVNKFFGNLILYLLTLTIFSFIWWSFRLEGPEVFSLPFLLLNLLSFAFFYLLGKRRYN
ncbi:hypothetical protein GF360_04205 [candidate division WWE3 bacterium]|nr:hypothetical protein [candidate division WWE3 bacterium]